MYRETGSEDLRVRCAQDHNDCTIHYYRTACRSDPEKHALKDLIMNRPSMQFKSEHIAGNSAACDGPMRDDVASKEASAARVSLLARHLIKCSCDESTAWQCC